MTGRLGFSSITNNDKISNLPRKRRLLPPVVRPSFGWACLGFAAIPRNLNRQRSGPGGHEGPLVTLWTGASVTRALYAGGPSVDQLIAKALPEGPTFRSLQFGVQHTSSGLNPRVLHTMTYAGADQPIAPESNPYRMFGRLMLGGAGQDFESLRKRRFRVIDAVQDELRALTPKIAAADRIKLEQHLEGCPHCTEYLAQLRVTIDALGRTTLLAPPDEAVDDLVELYRRWRAG